MIELVKAGDVTFHFDFKTSTIVVKAWECEVVRVKVNELFLAYNDKVGRCLTIPAEHQMRHRVESTNNKLPPLRERLDAFGARLLKQREKAWADGDALAGAVIVALSGRGNPNEVLGEALRKYADGQGWLGPACSLIKEKNSKRKKR